MSIDRRLRQEAADGTQRPEEDCSSYMMEDRSRHMTDFPDAAQIARQLTEKYGFDALAFARDRAARAMEIGDDLALDCWRSVIEATQSLLRQMADA